MGSGIDNTPLSSVQASIKRLGMKQKAPEQEAPNLFGRRVSSLSENDLEEQGVDVKKLIGQFERSQTNMADKHVELKVPRELLSAIVDDILFEAEVQQTESPVADDPLSQLNNQELKRVIVDDPLEPVLAEDHLKGVAHRTDLPLDVVREVQHLWDTHKGNIDKGVSLPINPNFSVILTKEGAIVEGKQLGKGGFNVVRLSQAIGADILSRASGPVDKQWVTRKPHGEQKTIPTSPKPPQPSVDGKVDGSSSIHSMPNGPPSGSVIYGADDADATPPDDADATPSGSVIYGADDADATPPDDADAPPSGSVIYGADDADAPPDDTAAPPSNTIKEGERIDPQKAVSSTTGKESTKMSPEEEARYYAARDIEFTLLAQGPGVVKAHSVIDLVSGDQVLVLEKGGIEVKRLNGSTKTIADLNNYIEKINTKKVSEADRLKVCEALSDALEGIERLHQTGIILRDLKLDNILISAEGKGVVCDLGALVRKTGDPAIKQLMGTERFLSPEAVGLSRREGPRKENKLENLTEQTDIWALGFMLYDLGLVADEEFPSEVLLNARDHSFSNAFFQGFYDSGSYPGRIPEPEPNTFEHLCWRCLEVDPKKRPTIEEFREEYDTALESWKQSSAEEEALNLWQEALPHE